MRKEIIKSIEIYDKDNNEGYLIKTNKQEIKMVIGSEQSCCENAGYLFTNDEFEDFIGASIISIEKVDTDLNKSEILIELDLTSSTKSDRNFDDGGDVIFINITTDKGTLQFAAYNSHNGYYGHFVEIKSEQFNLESSV